jgi:hypothetical protein
MMLPEPDRTFLMVAWHTTRSRLALAEGDVVEAEAIARRVVDDLQTKGVVVLEAEALLALARAHMAEDRPEEAMGDLAQAIGHADRLGERRVLWEALASSAELAVRSGGDPAEPRRRAREVVEEIAAGITDEDLRTRFLSREDVRALGREP